MKGGLLTAMVDVLSRCRDVYGCSAASWSHAEAPQNAAA
jgi:hypothetical protein